MNRKKIKSGIYAITPELTDTQKLLSMVKSVTSCGVRMLQYRSKTQDRDLKKYQISEIKKILPNNTIFIINDDIDLVKMFNCDGVHLGKHDQKIDFARKELGDDYIIGSSCYGKIELVNDSVLKGADYVAIGSIFSTKTKLDSSLINHDVISKLCDNRVPVVAIGGINKKNISDIARYNFFCVAICNGIFGEKNITEAVKIINYQFHKKNDR